MQARTGIAATAAILILWGGGWLSARQGRPEQPPAFRTGTEVVSIDVGVVDKKGQPVRGLGPGDFTVTVAGQPRAVVSAEFVDLAPASAEAAVPSDTGVISTNEGAGVGRTILFVVDQNTLDLGAARQVARSSAHFFTGLTFADRSALALLPVGPNVQFTWAHARVRDALQRVVGTGGLRQMWEYGSLADARDIANTGPMAMRTLGERECGGTSSAGAGSSGGGGGGGGAAPPTAGVGGGGPQGPTGGEGPAGGGGGAAPGGQGGGGGTSGGATGGSGGGGGATTRGSGSSGGFGMSSCLRDLQMQADSAWRMANATSLTSVTSLRQALGSLADVRGDKTIILISGGWPLDQRDEVSLMASVAEEAAAVRATIHTIFVPASTFAADRRGINFGSTRDQYIHLGPLETLASMTGGGTFRADVNADVAFETLRREMAGHYRIGVERAPGDVAAKNRRMKVQVSRGGVAVRARELFDVRTYEDRDWAARLASALESPVASTGVGLRMTSYLTSDPEDGGRLKLVLTGEASRLQPGEATFQLLVRDLEGKALLSGEKPLGQATGDTLPFSADIPVPPGSYIVRLAVMDGAGRVGSLDHRVEARQVTLGPLSASRPLLVRVPADRTLEPRVALDGVRQDERLALQVDLEGDRARLGGTSVVFEIAPASGGAPLVQSSATLSQGSREGTMLAQSVADVRLLPPGPYMVHAKVTAGGEALGEVRRAFAVTEAPRAAAGSVDVPVVTVDAGTRPKFSIQASIPPFAVEQVFDKEIVGAFLDKVAARPDARTPLMRGLLDQARNNPLDRLEVPDALAAEAPVAAFLQGLSLLARKKLDPAAIAFRRAMNAGGDFYPAMVYLGACYAAGGRDKEAAGAWRTALIKEGDAAPLHVLLTDSLLRQDRGDLALATVESARNRWPEHEGLKRRYALAALLAARYPEGFAAVDDMVAKGVEDEPSLALALSALYEAFARGSAIENVEQDRARMIRLAEAYRNQGGPSLALVNAWVAAATLER